MDNFGGECFNVSQYVWCNVCMCEMCIFCKRVSVIYRVQLQCTLLVN